MSEKKDFEKIVEVVKNKASIKQQIYRNTVTAFNQFKKTAEKIIEELSEKEAQFDDAVILSYRENGEFEFQIKIGGDIILIQMHTNVFDFDDSHPIWKTAYLKEDSNRAYCGLINIYNFLADSFKYNRYDDTGYLIGRVFVNMENHFFMEGTKQLNFLFNDLVNQKLDNVCIRKVLEQSILYSMNFDLFTPPYRHVQEISVGQMLQDASGMRIKTGKRLGFKFSFEGE